PAALSLRSSPPACGIAGRRGLDSPANAPVVCGAVIRGNRGNGGMRVFAAVGGTPSCTWTFVVNASGAGMPDSLTGAGALHTSGGAGADIIKVADANSTEAHATITKN
ncbi:MAG: hypothetical protein QME60_07725, partial [Verrucomicrobiota bacterium]|nr:hypothetical protein [Verrucomicrobiota bacterium]